MAAHNNPRLQLLSLSLLLFLHMARPDPKFSSNSGPSPSPSPSIVSGPSPSPSYASSPPSASISPAVNVDMDGPSPAPSPATSLDAGADVDGPAEFSGPGPSPSYAISLDADADVDGPEASAGPSPSPSDAPSASPEADADGPAASDGQAQFDLSFAPFPAADAGPEVKEICDSTDHPDLCLATVAPRLSGDDRDVPTVLEVSIRAGLDLARIGLSLAENVAAAAGSSPELASAVRDCSDRYSDAVYNLNAAIDALPSGDKDALKSKLSAAMTHVGDCEDGLARLQDDSPFTGLAEKLTNVTSNCLAIASLLH